MGAFGTTVMQRRGGRMLRISVVTAAIAALSVFGTPGGPVAAHDGIEASTPENRSTIDDPISSAEIDFGEGISDDVSMFLTYDPGDGSIVDIGGETTRTGDETARLDFPEIDVEGTYFVRYLAAVPSDGHVVAGSISFVWGTATATVDSPNPDIRTSTPSSRDVLTAPITTAEITFELDIGEDVSLQLVYDRGNGEDFDELQSVTTKTGPNSAMVEFDELEREGTYIVTYDTTNVFNGDEVVGATSFVFGQPSGASSGFPWLIFAPIALIVLGIGGFFTYKRMLVPIEDEETDDADELALTEA
ncbi:MAG: copper resistance protein CopC [Ilumatobacter sp.]|uniref:copper resistance CopC family protein n=1 Tax=Ilumatobacter sp. TaxID=1967498 RepID=UPI003C74009A